MSSTDSLTWRIESDPVLRSPVVVVGLLDRSPSPARVEAAIERAAAVLPRLHQRIEPAPFDLGPPRWVDAGPGPLDHHVRRVRAAGGDLDAVLALTEPDAVAAFDPARPPWMLTIVDGLDHGRSALVLRFHHAITDGVGGIEIADLLFDRARRGPGPAPAVPDAPAAPAAPAPRRPSRLPTPGAIAAGGRRAVRLGLAAAHPARTLATSARLGRSVLRLVAPASGGGSPALAGRSLDRRLAVSERPLAALRDAATAAGGTVNDVLLAAVAGALARYHREQYGPVRAVRVMMPISIRRSGDGLGGNRFVPTRFTLPVDDPDPEARVKIARAVSRAWRSEPGLRSTDPVAAGLDLLPRPVAARLFGGMLRSTDVGVVDVTGLDRRAFFAGARVTRLWAFAPTAGAALSITLVSHNGTCGIGLTCDRLAVTDPDLLAGCLEAALDELVALGRRGREAAATVRERSPATLRSSA
jgi:WS/DGAT/MGAT family acyltransferase